MPQCVLMSQKHAIKLGGAERPESQSHSDAEPKGQRLKGIWSLQTEVPTQGWKGTVCANLHCQPFFISTSKVALFSPSKPTKGSSILQSLVAQIQTRTCSNQPSSQAPPPAGFTHGHWSRRTGTQPGTPCRCRTGPSGSGQ